MLRKGQHTNKTPEEIYVICRNTFRIPIINRTDFEKRKKYLLNFPEFQDGRAVMPKFRDFVDAIYGGKCPYSHNFDYRLADEIRFRLENGLLVNYGYIELRLRQYCAVAKNKCLFEDLTLGDQWLKKFACRHYLPYNSICEGVSVSLVTSTKPMESNLENTLEDSLPLR